ncbi:MAG: lysophospholipase [Solirubrobacteraceae bacterium]|nr:lysophospholipase [Solirubrobacteraceae bacterium]
MNSAGTGATLLHADGAFVGAGDLRITWQSWEDATAPTRAHVVLAHGVAEHGGRYARLARELAPRGFPVWAIDHRGHGRSEGPRLYVDRADHAVADLAALIDHVAASDDGRPIFLLGHSMGGAIALRYALAHPGTLTGLIVSAPAATDDAAPAAMRFASRWLALDRILSRVTPGLGVLELDAAGLSRDPDEVAAYVGDPLVTRGKLPMRTVAEMRRMIRAFHRELGGLTVPLLVMHGEDDPLMPVAAARMIDERAGSEDRTLLIYPGLLHEIFNELPDDREAVTTDVVAWLDLRAPRRTGRFKR